MNKLTTFKSLLREEKTLIIACHGQEGKTKLERNENLFLISSSGNVLQRYSYVQQENFRHYVEDKGCKQIVVVGHNHAGAIEHIMNNPSTAQLVDELTFSNKPFSRPYVMDKVALERALLEFNIIEQCNLLLEYDFIRERLRRKLLTLLGVVTAAATSEASQIYYNGIVYNNLVSLN
ncbi:MAG TPA: carbonic anhydrase [Ohtaekwangia sp.]|uniref:carbonic anhydrase n=1 Tax=Ohtaekwangia sp. TaxID=2066019 RepID=UPI002F948240